MLNENCGWLMGVGELIRKKKNFFSREFSKKYSLKLIGMQAWDNKDGRELAAVSFAFGELMTVLDVQVVCEKVAKWFGGTLYGTVNLDFSGDEPSLEMMVEFQR